ncbi:MAG: hypothetical protein WAU45_00445 [Blastocatellia bacterium]
MRGRALTTAVMLLWWPIPAGIPLARPATPQDKTYRDQATKAISDAIFKTMKAFLTGDVKTLRQRSTQRTLDLVNLVYEAARKDSRLQEELRSARVTNADEFLGFFMQGMANQYLQALPLPPEQAARRAANDAVVSLTSRSEARIMVGDSEFARAKLVAREWKIDLTDLLKRAVLREVKNPEMRARIKSL